MALTVAELERQLQPLLEKCAAVEHLADGWYLRRRAGAVTVHYRSLLASRLGSLELPRLEIVIRVSGESANEKSSFVADFLRYVGRGGG